MAYEITSGKIIKPLKVVTYGPEGIGKSTFASKFPDPLFIDTEDGSGDIDVKRLPRPTSWAMLMDEIQYVKDNPGICKTLTIDTADWAEKLCATDICARYKKNGIEDFGYSKGYTYLSEQFGKMLNLLQDVVDGGTNVHITAHAVMRKFEQPDELGAYDRWELKLQKKTAPLLKEWADMLLFVNYRTFVVKSSNEMEKAKVTGGKRMMYTTHNPCWDAKNRKDLPDMIDFDFANIAHCFKEIAPSESPAPAPAPEPKPQPQEEEKDVTKEVQEAMGEIPKEEPKPEQPKPVTSDDPLQQLWALMEANAVDRELLQKTVAKKGYYPVDTPIEKYDPEFVKAVLIAAWPKVNEMATEILNEDIPF